MDFLPAAFQNVKTKQIKRIRAERCFTIYILHHPLPFVRIIGLTATIRHVLSLQFSALESSIVSNLSVNLYNLLNVNTCSLTSHHNNAAKFSLTLLVLRVVL